MTDLFRHPTVIDLANHLEGSETQPEPKPAPNIAISSPSRRSRRLDARRSVSEQPQLLRQGELEMDLERMSARWREQPLGLTLTEFWLVHALARRPGHVKNRQQLMDAANTVLDDSTVTSHIKRIRRKFQELDSGFNAIETMYGMGYRWSEDNISP